MYVWLNLVIVIHIVGERLRLWLLVRSLQKLREKRDCYWELSFSIELFIQFLFSFIFGLEIF